jgi:guanylate kinase
VLSGPGGAGKGTVAEQLVAGDPSLWLSRSWTTRAPRPGEDPHAYVFVDRSAFEEQIERGGFLEWAEFLGNLYGTPWPDAPPGRDVLLEIDLQGAQQVATRFPEALVILLVPPSPEVQAQRLRGRGDTDEHVAQRLAKGQEEEALGRSLTPHVVTNVEVGQAVADVAGIVQATRAARAQLGAHG